MRCRWWQCWQLRWRSVSSELTGAVAADLRADIAVTNVIPRIWDEVDHATGAAEGRGSAEVVGRRVGGVKRPIETLGIARECGAGCEPGARAYRVSDVRRTVQAHVGWCR